MTTDSIPVEDLEELVSLWSGMANDAPRPNATTLEWCSDELEALLEEHTDE